MFWWALIYPHPSGLLNGHSVNWIICIMPSVPVAWFINDHLINGDTKTPATYLLFVLLVVFVFFWWFHNRFNNSYGSCYSVTHKSDWSVSYLFNWRYNHGRSWEKLWSSQRIKTFYKREDKRSFYRNVTKSQWFAESVRGETNTYLNIVYHIILVISVAAIFSELIAAYKSISYTKAATRQ